MDLPRKDGKRDRADRIGLRTHREFAYGDDPEEAGCRQSDPNGGKGDTRADHSVKPTGGTI
ncbi:hypothetical protein D9M70_641030 [compost metagenome]